MDSLPMDPRLDADETESGAGRSTEEAGEDAAEEASVLVVVINNVRDWGLVQREGWYRVPVRRAPRQIGADYLAFYQTAAFGEEKWGIRYYAPVAGVRLARRQELLPDEPDHPRAGELYYRFALGALAVRDPPLLSRRLRRVAFIHTTLERLLDAEDLVDLWIKQPLRERLWVEFNRQGLHAQREVAVREDPAAYVFDFVIPCCAGGVAVDCVPASAGAIGTCEEPSRYGAADREEALDAARWSLLRFADATDGERLVLYVDTVWREVECRGGQLAMT